MVKEFLGGLSPSSIYDEYRVFFSKNFLMGFINLILNITDASTESY